MDSGNSGSLQSSSGGDEEYDSRAADSVSAFMSGSGGPMSTPPPPFFDPLSNYLQLHQNPNSSSLFNPTWQRNTTSLRSDPNPVTHDVINSMLPGSSPYMPPFQPPHPAGADNAAVAPPQARNPKKRSRASRRAPTTVLTTDTTNFRAMVQEFTGIPAPPFSNSSFPRSRVDLFSMRSDAAQPPPYLRRPFPQKIQPPHSLLSSAAAAASSSTPSINYHLPITQNSNIFNLPNPLLTSLLQSNPKFPFSTSPLIPSNINKMGGLDEQFINPTHGNNVSETLNAFPNLINSNQIGLQTDHIDNRVGSEDKDEAGLNLRPLNGSYGFSRNAVNSATSTSNFHGGKAPESAVASRGEGMLESWICSSD